MLDIASLYYGFTSIVSYNTVAQDIALWKFGRAQRPLGQLGLSVSGRAQGEYRRDVLWVTFPVVLCAYMFLWSNRAILALVRE